MTTRNRSVLAWIAYPLLAVVLYVLSIGPVFTKLNFQCSWCRQVYMVFYSPILSLAERSDYLDEKLCRYMSWCCGGEVPTEKQIREAREREVRRRGERD